MERTVRDVMHQGVLTCKPDIPIQEVARQMVEHDVSALVVVDESNHMLGLISRTDLVKLRIDAQSKDNWRDLPVSQIMVKDVVAVHADDTLQYASELIMKRHIHRVVVIEDDEDGKRPVGILSITDVVRDLAE
jgi:signal-transduction protein with cAMP-binding, CBS, and nucleotidyltransferase domain